MKRNRARFRVHGVCRRRVACLTVWLVLCARFLLFFFLLEKSTCAMTMMLLQQPPPQPTLGFSVAVKSECPSECIPVRVLNNVLRHLKRRFLCKNQHFLHYWSMGPGGIRAVETARYLSSITSWRRSCSLHRHWRLACLMRYDDYTAVDLYW